MGRARTPSGHGNIAVQDVLAHPQRGVQRKGRIVSVIRLDDDHPVTTRGGDVPPRVDERGGDPLTSVRDIDREVVHGELAARLFERAGLMGREAADHGAVDQGDQRDESAWGGTPLHWAAWNGQATLVRQLLDAGAPVNRRDSRYGSSPIAWAAHGSRFSVREKGAEADRDYRALVTQRLDAGATREEAINQWRGPPEAMGSEAVAAVLLERGWAG